MIICDPSIHQRLSLGEFSFFCGRVNCAAGAILSTPCDRAKLKSAALGSFAKTPPSQKASDNTQVFGIRQIPELMAYLDYYVVATATLDGHICPQTLTILHHARPELFSTRLHLLASPAYRRPTVMRHED